MFRQHFLPHLVFWFYRVLSATWRTTIIETAAMRHSLQQRERMLFAHWHRDELGVLQCVRRYRVATMTSHSKDGQLIDHVIRHFGGATSKGSSSRGGSEALRGLLRLMKAGRIGSIAVDGPRGPIFKAKQGVFEICKLSHGCIVPVGVASRHRHVFSGSWNQARLPLPFTRIIVWFGDPIRLADLPSGDLRSPVVAAMLEQRIRDCCRFAREHGLDLVGARCRDPGGFGQAAAAAGMPLTLKS